MMTHELEVSIVAAPLEAIDRRALSQAWYSALRLATPPRHVSIRPIPQRCLTGPALGCRPAFTRAREGTKPYLYSKRGLRSELRGTHTGEAPALRQSSQSRLAARIEQTFAAAWTPKRATFSLGRGNARVHVVLQATPTQTILVALCRPELRADVRQALAQARMALAARGVALDLCKLGGRACS